MKITATFQITAWNENTLQTFANDSKITQATVTQTYQGTMTGNSTINYLMHYSPQGTATFVGFEVFTGSIDGKSGSTVFQHNGLFADGKAKSSWQVMSGLGTEELAHLHGSGNYVAGHGEPAQVSFDYHFDLIKPAV